MTYVNTFYRTFIIHNGTSISTVNLSHQFWNDDKLFNFKIKHYNKLETENTFCFTIHNKNVCFQCTQFSFSMYPKLSLFCITMKPFYFCKISFYCFILTLANCFYTLKLGLMTWLLRWLEPDIFIYIICIIITHILNQTV